jgi:hypothetical protein
VVKKQASGAADSETAGLQEEIEELEGVLA